MRQGGLECRPAASKSQQSQERGRDLRVAAPSSFSDDPPSPRTCCGSEPRAAVFFGTLAQSSHRDGRRLHRAAVGGLRSLRVAGRHQPGAGSGPAAGDGPRAGVRRHCRSLLAAVVHRRRGRRQSRRVPRHRAGRRVRAPPWRWRCWPAWARGCSRRPPSRACRVSCSGDVYRRRRRFTERSRTWASPSARLWPPASCSSVGARRSSWSTPSALRRLRSFSRGCASARLASAPASDGRLARSLLRDARAGLVATVGFTGLRTVLLTSAVALFFAGIFNVAELLFVQGDLGASSAGFSARRRALRGGLHGRLARGLARRRAALLEAVVPRGPRAHRRGLSRVRPGTVGCRRGRGIHRRRIRERAAPGLRAPDHPGHRAGPSRGSDIRREGRSHRLGLRKRVRRGSRAHRADRSADLDRARRSGRSRDLARCGRAASQ